MVVTPTVLLYSPHPSAPGEPDYQGALEAAGYEVVKSATVSGCIPALDRGVQLVVLDDPPWELARTLVATADAAPLPMPRLWISSWSKAPSLAGKLGVDALVLERDAAALVEVVHRTLATWQPATDEVPAPRRSFRRATTTPELHPHGHAAVDEGGPDTSDSWP
ncbi:MAG TPA: hypothetical protein VHE35_32325 [Kofleriaceae bacterium]|nr:hypothetical protein [Kofleriaceae bacterium]